MFNASTIDESVTIAFVKPIPMIAPISVCELDAGIPKYHVPKFQIMAANSNEKTMARP